MPYTKDPYARGGGAYSKDPYHDSRPGPAPAPAPTHSHGHHGLLHAVEKFSGAELASNLLKDVGKTAVGIGPGLVGAGKRLAQGTKAALTGDEAGLHEFNQHLKEGGAGIGKQYADYYGHDLRHHLYTHPLQPILDATTVASGGATAVAKGGAVAAKLGAISEESKLAKLGDRATVTTRSPRAIARGKGPVHTDITSTKPVVKAREQAGAALRANPKLVERRGGELQQYGKQIQAEANQHALSRLNHYEPYQKATRHLSKDEWTALHIRALDIHPDDLAELWKGTKAADTVADPAIRRLVLAPSKRMKVAEPEAERLSQAGAALYKETGKLADETAEARPAQAKKQAAEVLGRPVKEITGSPYYFPHTLEPQKIASPLKASGGGKGVPQRLGSMKQNTGALVLHGKLHLRSDVLGPEFLRRVKFVKYDEVHNALVRGAVPVTRKMVDEHFGGKLPKGWEYVREKASMRIPPSIRGEGEQHVAIDKLIPNPEDLHDSQLAKDGFSTTDATQAHTRRGVYYIVPKHTVKAATGEFTRSSDFTHAFVKRPLTVWRAAVLGLRVGFLTNNLIGNSIMYAAKTGGQGALRDLFGAILETHGPKVAREALDNAATPPKLRQDLYREYFPEQIHGTFGRTQTPATSPIHVAGRRSVEAGRAVTGALPRLTSKVAEEYPRRALIRHYIRHSPEFKKVYSSLPKQTRTFEEAARKVLKGEGAAYQRYISKQVNHALGDYMNLSPMERNVLRNAFPFYSWYRAITVTTYHLAADTPLRAEAIATLGRIGKQNSDEQLGDVPSFLEGAVPLGDGAHGTRKVLATQGLDPYATLEQLRRGATEDFTDLGLNPFPVAVANTISRAKNGKVSPGELVLKSLRDIVRGLPPARVIAPQPPSRLYPNRNRKSELLGFLGAPVKEYDPAAAAYQKSLDR